MTRQNAPLGTISVDQFMREYWQRKPLLVRQALPGFTSPIAFDEVLALARDPDVESRLVSAFDGKWALARGPFGARQIPSRRRPDWTVLVQGMDLHHDAAHEMLSRFRFLADARLDDLMVSVATRGGGVGPHLDSYDVFLIQAQGHRRWRIAPPGDARLRPDLPLKILENFAPTQDWVLEPGDLLYLPPGWGHDGVAQDECMTWSVGFRAPSRREVLAAWFAELAEQPVEGPDPRFGDAGVAAARHPGRLPAELHAQMHDWITQFQPDARSVDDFIGRFLTEPKSGVWFEGPDRLPALAAFMRQAARRGLRLDRRSRMAYRGTRFYLNGEVFDAPAAARPLLRTLADDRHLAGVALKALAAREDGALALLHDWFDAGWIGWNS